MTDLLSRASSILRSQGGTRRTRHLRMILTLSIAVLAGVVTLRAVAGAEATRDRFGTLRSMPVATHDLAIGHVIVSNDLEWILLPIALSATSTVEDPIGRTVIEPILDNEVLVDARISGSVGAGRAAVIDRTSRAISIERSALTPPMRPGERVDIYTASPRSGATAIARHALVLEVDDRAITVVVSETETAAVARAVIDGSVILALRGEV